LEAGSGHLGLATVRGRAANEGGHVTITSAPGTGTSVVLTLPKHAAVAVVERADAGG
jgi:signal transduction histidine kinase